MRIENELPKIIPAATTLKQFEQALASPYEYLLLLEVHLSQLMTMKREAKKHGKKLILHADLIHGLKTDQFAADFLCHDIAPAGIISTRANMILKAKQQRILAIQRMFLIDSIALDKSYHLIETTKPDYIELLPGIIPSMIEEVQRNMGIPIITGGLIRTQDQIEAAWQAGAVSITTSNKELWL